MRPRRGDEVRWLEYLGLPSLFAAKRRWRAVSEGPGVQFAARFLAVFAVLAFLSFFFILDRQPIQDGTAAAVAWSSNLLGLPASRAGSIVTFQGSASYDVEFGCTGLAVATMLVSAVLAYPASLRARAIGAVLGPPFVFVVNLARLDSMGWLAVHARAWFEIVHGFAWEAGVILIGAFGFLAWVRLFADPGEAGPARTRWEDILPSIPLFAVLFVGLTWLAYQAGVDVALGNALVPAVGPVGHALWGDAFPPPDLGAGLDARKFVTIFTGFASVALATPRAPLRSRALAALGAGVPAILGALLHALMRSALLLHRVSSGTLYYTMDGLAYIGFPIAMWMLWATRSSRRRASAPAKTPRTAV
jgi:exosortase/archaeosortase family protein